jgi:hypothetical protein
MNLHSPHIFVQGLRSLARVVAAVTLTTCLLIAAGVHAAERFVDGIEDLPLMAGLRNVPEASVAFDSGTGRIVVAFADEEHAAKIDFPAVLRFYADTLPQLGWTAGTASERLARWTREGEELVLEAVATGPKLVVRFSLSPR